MILFIRESCDKVKCFFRYSDWEPPDVAAFFMAEIQNKNYA
ncbi:hypothetical protein HMP0721_0615 [Pseudoramibacter alactolyticus ATCC 23263]|uniref:Uncharacterized protein n=1 Tax=Pseudoramibacter alactolyticus ATCC 23263 TaxID=887929 RepID=E6MF32_9FIRM|nr:hypothetical protein HMP0721_0615 [Pseudoramibacter alactolyticus ATCC 23263]